MGENSVINFEADVKQLVVVGLKLSFGKGAVIDGRGWNGRQGAQGRSGNSTPCGADGGNGTDGSNGGDGTNGVDISLKVGIEKMETLIVYLSGGDGGWGGVGGSGSSSSGNFGSPGCKPGAGGNGGDGGNGGNGGDGGILKLEYFFLDDTEKKMNNEGSAGTSGRIGIFFRIQEDSVIVISVLSGGPSEQAGILPGDHIVKVNGKNVTGKGMTDSQISEMLRGPQGSKVNISVRRKGSSKLFEYAITRDKFPLIKFFSDRGSYGDGGTGGHPGAGGDSQYSGISSGGWGQSGNTGYPGGSGRRGNLIMISM